MNTIRLSLTIKALCLTLFVTAVQAQEDDGRYKLYLKTQAYQDSVVLRWVPGNYYSWQRANFNGVKVERKKTNQKEWTVIHEGLLKPLTLEQWKQRTDTTSLYVTTAAQMLYGNPTLETSNAMKMSEKLTVAKEQNNRIGMAAIAAEFSIEAADGLAWRFVDKNVEAKTVYVYRVTVGGETKIGEGSAQVLTSKVYQPQKAKRLTVENGDGKITLSWPTPENSKNFSGYIVEKSDDNGETFQRVNEALLFARSASDSIKIQKFTDDVSEYYRDYKYRIVGITSFADRGLYSDVVTGQSIDLRPPAPPAVFGAKPVDEKTVRLTWEEKEEQPEDHVGYRIYRATQYDGPFEEISNGLLKKKERSFVDASPVLYKTNFYLIETSDDKNNRAKGFPQMVVLPDATPPNKPEELIGSVDTLGVVSLAWPFGKEKDLMGYRVYRATAENREFNQITKEPIPGNFYRDTIPINTLTEHIYYKIAAFDFNYNPSPYSEIIDLKRPDMVPPAAPAISDFQVTSDSVTILWQNSPSKDVVKQILYRKSDTTGWSKLAELDLSRQYFTDRSIKVGEVYEYSISAVDDVGWESKRSFSITAHIHDNGLRKSYLSLRGEFNSTDKNFILKWEFADQLKFKKVLIYKGTSKDQLKIIATVSGMQRAYTDYQFYKNESGYVYAIKGLADDGAETIFSNTVNAKF